MDDPQTSVVDVRIPGLSRPVLSFELRLREDQPAPVFYVCHCNGAAPTRSTC